MQHRPLRGWDGRELEKWTNRKQLGISTRGKGARAEGFLIEVVRCVGMPREGSKGRKGHHTGGESCDIPGSNMYRDRFCWPAHLGELINGNDALYIRISIFCVIFNSAPTFPSTSRMLLVNSFSLVSKELRFKRKSSNGEPRLSGKDSLFPPWLCHSSVDLGQAASCTIALDYKTGHT